MIPVSPDVAIIGGGPAGLMAAIGAAQRGCRVSVYEQMAKPGRKLLATGGGRCNITNRLPPRRFIERFAAVQRPFVRSALAGLDPAALELFFVQHGLQTICEDGLHVFPASQRAADVLGVLLDECRRRGVTLRTGCAVSGIDIEDNTVRGVLTAQGRIGAARVVVATGGRSYEALGATGSGYTLAAQAGHRIVSPLPALSGLQTVQDWPAQCAGVVVADCRIWLAGARRDTACGGELLFTHQGVSGPAVLDISGAVVRAFAAQGGAAVHVDLLPACGEEQWRAMFEGWRVTDGKKQMLTLLAAVLPRSVACALCALAGSAVTVRAGELARSARERLIGLVRGVRLDIAAMPSFAGAMLTSGGVALDDVDPQTLASRTVRGLFFAGEVLDIDGPCGGFNLQWAFSSGMLAGLGAGSP